MVITLVAMKFIFITLNPAVVLFFFFFLDGGGWVILSFLVSQFWKTFNTLTYCFWQLIKCHSLPRRYAWA